MTGGDHVAVDCGIEDPAQRAVAPLLELGGDADPVRVHRRRQRGGRRIAGEPALAGDHVGEAVTPAAELCRHGGSEVSDLAQFGEVLVEVGVGPVEFSGAGPETLQHLGGQLDPGV